MNGRRHGYGKMLYQKGEHKGDIYEGDWYCDNRHGKGSYTWKNGDSYKGEWSMNKRHGLGE